MYYIICFLETEIIYKFDVHTKKSNINSYGTRAPGDSIMTKRKKYITSLRLDEKTNERLDSLSEELHLTKTEILQRAFMGFYDRHTRLQDLYKGIMQDDPEGAVVIGRPMFKFLLEALHEDQIVTLADNIAKKLISLIEFKMRENHIEIQQREIMNRLSKIVSGGILGWFDEFKVIERNQGFEILGTHRNGVKFSVFFKYLLENLAVHLGGYQSVEDSFDGTDITFAATFTKPEAAN